MARNHESYNELTENTNVSHRFTQMQPRHDQAFGNADEIFREAEKIFTCSADFMVNAHQIYTTARDLDQHFRLCIAEADPVKTGIGLGYLEGLTTLGISDPGFSSLCTYTGVSSAYARRCVEGNKLELLADNFNAWLADKNNEKRIRLRTTDELLYAMLSDHYSTYEDIDAIQTLASILEKENKYDIVGAYVGPDLMRLRIVSRDSFVVGKDGNDRLSYGFDVTNSRIGKSSMRITFLIYRHICGNGMLFNGGKASFYTRRHYGVTADEFSSEVKDAIQQLPQLVAYAKGAVEVAAVKKITSDEVEKLIWQFKSCHVPKKAEEQIVAEITKEQLCGNIQVVWDFTNILTAAARDMTLQTRELLESTASNILLQASGVK